MSTLGAVVRSALLAVVGIFALGAPLAAQIPGGDPDESLQRRQVARLKYRAATLGKVNDVLEDWSNDWRDDDADALADRYAESATVRGLPFGGANGREAIETALGELLSRAGDVRLRLQDFEASGRLAFGLGRYEFSTAAETSGSVTRKGEVLIVFERIRDDWKIRSQLFRPDEGSGGGATSG